MPTSSPSCAAQGCRTDYPVDCDGDTEPQTVVHATVIVGGAPVNFLAIDQQHLSEKWHVRLCQAQIASQYASGFPVPRIVGGDFNEEVARRG